MYKELVRDPNVPEFDAIPSHGWLEGWAKQGVLLLNAVLSVEASKANSHKDQGWETLTTAVIKWISNNLRDVVFLLWGAYAQKKAAVVDKSKHVCLLAVHPSPLSAHKGFLGSGHFSKCNDALISRGLEPIRWHQLD
ncbi:Uracil-DNA glycosylase [Orchesella cincta]|uniref:Uracil-DNA glycosylase n=1 Tax=Orchesella cincta TaxID=48709 RepID=A0A1D2NHJ8_ORCCI|nr:Uracil-DNA glycosylase [Orchesella cincta]